MDAAERIGLREATADDVPAMFHVRTHVRENLLTIEQLERLGITHESVRQSLEGRCKAWVAEAADGRVVGFSIADREGGSIFALFVLPEYEGRGIGTRLLDAAVAWLWEQGAEVVWLTTGWRSAAVRFYERRGWTRSEEPALGEYRFELRRDRGAPGKAGG